MYRLNGRTAGSTERGQETEACKASGDCRCRQPLSSTRASPAMGRTDRQGGGVYCLLNESQSAGVYWAPTMCFSAECSREEAVVSPGRGMLGKPYLRNESYEERGQRALRGGAGPPDRGEESHPRKVSIRSDGCRARVGQHKHRQEEQGVWGSSGESTPTRAEAVSAAHQRPKLSAEAGGAPPSGPWTPWPWPAPHLPMPVAAVFIPSSGPFGPPW